MKKGHGGEWDRDTVEEREKERERDGWWFSRKNLREIFTIILKLAHAQLGIEEVNNGLFWDSVLLVFWFLVNFL